jgi:hypothetical protein
VTPCPPVFVNEPFTVYPPCPSFEVLRPVPSPVIEVVAFVGVALVLVIAVALVAIVVTLLRD